MEVKNRLKSLREELKLTQEQLSEKTGLKRYSISDYEIGRAEPDVKTIDLLATFFDVSSDYLLGRTNIRNPELELDIDALSDVEFALFGEVKELNDEQIVELIRFAKFIKSK